MCDILIIDDDKNINQLIQEINCVNYDKDIISFATTCEEGIRKYCETLPEFVFLDMMLPAGDKICGTEVFAAIKKMNPDVVIFLMTGSQNNEKIGNMIGDGLDGYISKQGNYAELIVSIIISVIKNICK